MAYCVRDPIYNSTYQEFPPRGLVKRLRLHSRCYDAHLVIDGRVAYKFNDGAEAIFEVVFLLPLVHLIFRGEMSAKENYKLKLLRKKQE